MNLDPRDNRRAADGCGTECGCTGGNMTQPKLTRCESCGRIVLLAIFHVGPKGLIKTTCLGCK